MASASELNIEISVEHRIRGLFLVGMKFLKMAAGQIFTRAPKEKAKLNYVIEINLVQDLKPYKPKRQYGAIQELADIPEAYHLGPDPTGTGPYK